MTTSNAEDIARARLERGEIAPDEYREILRNLRAGRGNAPRSPEAGHSSGWALLGVVVAAAVVLAAVAVLGAFSRSGTPTPAYAMGTITQAAFSAINSPPAGAVVDPAQNTLRANANGTSIMIEGSPLWDPRPGDFFLAYGLANPTLVLPVDATTGFLFVNMDNETHNFAVTTVAPPYSHMPMMEGGMMSGGDGGWPAMSPMLPGVSSFQGNGTLYQDVTVTMTFPHAGTYWYLCLYPGHAEMGMYGKIVVSG